MLRIYGYSTSCKKSLPLAWRRLHGWLCLLLLLFLILLFSLQTIAAAAEAKPNESGWKYLYWGMTPAQVAESMKQHGTTFDGSPLAEQSFWYGFDDQQRPLVHPFDERDKNRLCWVRSGLGATDLLFLDNRLFGVLVHNKASENAINDLLVRMIDYYPKAQLLPGDSPSNVIFQHQTSGRVIIWESDHASFKLGFFDKDALRVFTGFLPQPMENDFFKRKQDLEDPGELLPGSKEAQAGKEKVQEKESSATPTSGLETGTKAANEADTPPQAAQTENQIPAEKIVQESASGPKLGDSWTDPTTGIHFVWIPGGCYTRGQTEAGTNELINFLGEKEYRAKHATELPRHQSCVDGFWLSDREITNKQFRMYKPVHDSGVQDSFSLNGDTQPAVFLTFTEAVGFGNWLAKQDQKVADAPMTEPLFRLPTEAEWEYACRAGTDTIRYWGDDSKNACSHANVADKQFVKTSRSKDIIHPCDDGFAVTAPVGSFPPNPWGLYDMLGNAWEWTLDKYGDYFHVMQQPDNPLNDEGYGSARAIRGGGWASPPTTIRSAAHLPLSPMSRLNSVGFRLVMMKNPVQIDQTENTQ